MRYIVLSVNEDPVYTYYVPLAIWAWRKIGWEPLVIINGWNKKTIDSIYKSTEKHIPIDYVLPYRSDTVTQVSRLYAAMNKELNTDDYLMTGDIDLIPLSDYWHPNPNAISVYGHDLTNFTHYPICYIGMTRGKWIEVMGLDPNKTIGQLIKRDLDQMPQASSPDFMHYWFTDQDLITDRINATQFPKEFHNRGKLPNGLAIGRVDRGSWSLNHPVFIDAHLHRDLYKAFQNPNHEHYELYQKKWREHMELLKAVWPNEDWTWFIEYTKKFAALA